LRLIKQFYSGTTACRR